MRIGKYRKIFSSLLFIVILLLLPGCWDSHELNKFAIVAGLGFDIDPGTGDTMATYQTIVPSQVKNASVGSGGGEQKGGGAPTAVQIDHTTGSTPYDALSRYMQHASRIPFYAHAQFCIFGKKAAMRGIYPFIDTIARNVQSRPGVLVAVADKKASDILGIQDGMENIQASGLVNSIKLSEVFSKYPAVTFLEFSNRLLSKSTAPIAPILGIYEETGQNGKMIRKARIIGTAVFKGEKMIGELNEQESRGLLWVTGKIKVGFVMVPDASLEIVGAKCKIVPKLEDDKIQMTVEIQEQSNLIQYKGQQDLTPGILKELEKRQSEEIKKEVLAAVQKSFFLGADIFGFGEALHRSYKKEWEVMEPRWDELYPNIEVVVKIKTHLNEVGDVSKALIKH